MKNFDPFTESADRQIQEFQDIHSNRENDVSTTTTTTLGDIPRGEIAAICLRSAGSGRAHAYSHYRDLSQLKTQHAATELVWDGAYGCYVMTRVGGPVATRMVYVNREPENAD